MYDELVKMFRTCAERDSCIGWREACPYLGTGACDNKAEKAADAIEDLEFACNRYEKDYKALCEYLPKWIPVTERLPDYPGRFICYYKHETDNEVGYCIDWGRYDPDDGWYASGVTHWQKVPEPPKEE